MRFCVLFAILPLLAQERPIDTGRSMITIHVGKAGLFSPAAHEHWVDAPVASGTITEGEPAHVEFRVQSARLMVRPDRKVDAKTQAEIQRDMQEKTLESSQYPEIVFRSNGVAKAADGQFEVDGTLMLHGVSKPVSVNVKRAGDAWTGRTVIKQTDFAIKPIRLGGGLIRIKDALEIEFQIFQRAGN